MTKLKNKRGEAKTIWLIALGMIVFAAGVAKLLQGTDVALFNPKGLIAQQQHYLTLFAVGLLLTAAAPTLILLYAFAWRYRETNEDAVYEPDTHHGKFFVFSLWAIPSIFMLILASVMWPATHKLQPQKQIDASVKPLTIQVIAMRWKWLFIYPDQNIATVNFVQIPTDTPVQFELSADETPMSSFWIPHLGGQLYAMTGHVNRLNLMADEPGDYPGSSAEINGAGFAGMKFRARATSKEDFDIWVQDIKLSSDVLDSEEYRELLKPSESHPVILYSSAETDLYAKMLMKYAGSHDHGTATEETEH
jgi:cytochrome o ubiquinol oxidase subunit II